MFYIEGMINILIFLVLWLHNLPIFGEVTIIGHRGSPCSAPENTLASFKQAMEAGADFIEFDVHLTKDGIPVVTHDPQLGRTVCISYPIGVNCLTLEELRNYDAGVLYHHNFKGERVPTLEEVFAFADGKIGMMIEIKTGSAHELKLAEAVMHLIENKENRDKPILVASFSPLVLSRVKELNPKQPILALAEYQEEFEAHHENAPEYYGLGVGLITKEMVSSLRENGKKVWVWTVNDETLKDNLIAMGVNGLITNRPMALRICKETTAAQSLR
jgi:glycerophosphoryl diester phosphodiesterase